MTPLLSTVILDPTTALIGGCAVALFSMKLIQKNPQVELKRTALLGALWGLWWGLTVSYLYFRFTDWMLAYLVDAKTISVPLTYLVFVAVLVLHGTLAALGVGALMLHHKLGLAIAITAGVVITNVLLLAVQAHAYNHVGTFAEYAAGTARELSQVPEAQLGMTVAGILAAGVGISVLVLRFLAGRRALPPAAPAAPGNTAGVVA
jgi:hypothetical protein